MILPLARECADIVADPNNATNAYFALALGNIATALGTGAFTCTLTTSGKAGANVQAIRQALIQRGFTLTQTTTTITISWANA